MCADPRSLIWRRRDTERRLGQDVDIWVATASPDGAPYLVPLSFDWDGRSLVLATAAGSPTGRHLAATGRVRLGLASTRDVTVIDGRVEVGGVTPAAADRFAARTGFDPRDQHPAFRWFLVSPIRIQAWRAVDELPGRDLMRAGRWVA